MNRVIKRDGTEVDFDIEKINSAIHKANNELEHKASETVLASVVCDVVDYFVPYTHSIDIEDIQDRVENVLMMHSLYTLAKAYIKYRYEHKLQRESVMDKKIMSLVEYNNESVKQENSNKDPEIIPTQRDYLAGEMSKDLSVRKLLPKKIVDAHNQGIIHFHDMDYFIQHSHNCDLVNLDDMLQNGTVISGTMIEKPHSFGTACTIATQIVAQVASCQYGGQSISLAHLSPFVQRSRELYRSKYPRESIGLSVERYDELIEEMVHNNIVQGIQTIQYQIITLMTTNGQAPFVTLYMDINEAPKGQAREDLAHCIEEVLRQRIRGVKNEKGVYITPAFPKLIYALDDNNAYQGSEYRYLTELAAECTAKRMVPDYISNKVQRELKDGNTYTCMGCRSFLTVDRTEENYSKCKNWNKGHKYYGRFNQGVVTLNLPDAALSSGGDEKEFWKILDERLQLCYEALMLRHKRLKGTPSNVAPILWQYGALARLDRDETIDRLLYHGYSTISLGYAGLYECTRYMTGHSHTDEEGKGFALNVMQRLNDACSKWKAETDIDFSLYGTPLESTTYKFAKCLQKRFGIIEHVTDKNYITNSYHVHVTEPIDAFTKLKFESEFQQLSPGGAISYVEVPNMANNPNALISVIQFIYENIMYAEINTKSDYCQVCGYEGEIQIVKDDAGKLVWECPNCKNRDQGKLNVARRTCGYIGTNFWNQGRTQEIADRVLHLGMHTYRK